MKALDLINIPNNAIKNIVIRIFVISNYLKVRYVIIFLQCKNVATKNIHIVCELDTIEETKIKATQKNPKQTHYRQNIYSI